MTGYRNAFSGLSGGNELFLGAIFFAASIGIDTEAKLARDRDRTCAVEVKFAFSDDSLLELPSVIYDGNKYKVLMQANDAFQFNLLDAQAR